MRHDAAGFRGPRLERVDYRVEQTYFRKGFGLKQEIEGDLATYHSRVVDQIRANGYQLVAGNLTFLLAEEFGFCYGVDRRTMRPQPLPKDLRDSFAPFAMTEDAARQQLGPGVA